MGLLPFAIRSLTASSTVLPSPLLMMTVSSNSLATSLRTRFSACFANALVDRGVRVLFIDEVLALFLHCSRDHLERTFDILRDLTNGLGLTVVLVATGRLLAAWRDLPDCLLPDGVRSALDDVPSSAEFGRRRNVVYFPHYHCGCP